MRRRLEKIVNFFVNASLAGVAERLAVFPVKADLGGDDHVLTPSALGQRLAHDLLRAAEAIGWRGIDQRDATIDRLADDGDRRRFISSAPHPSADRPCAEADAGHLEGSGEIFDLGAVVLDLRGRNIRKCSRVRHDLSLEYGDVTIMVRVTPSATARPFPLGSGRQRVGLWQPNPRFEVVRPTFRIGMDGSIVRAWRRRDGCY